MNRIESDQIWFTLSELEKRAESGQGGATGAPTGSQTGSQTGPVGHPVAHPVGCPVLPRFAETRARHAFEIRHLMHNINM